MPPKPTSKAAAKPAKSAKAEKPKAALPAAKPKAALPVAAAPARAGKSNGHIFLIDGSSYIFRAYFAMFKAAQSRGRACLVRN